jgi:hypothetical protein
LGTIGLNEVAMMGGIKNFTAAEMALAISRMMASGLMNRSRI